jgi:hypothetical protein
MTDEMKDEMKNDCAKWKDQLLEAALTGTSPRTPAGGLAEHMSKCANCTAELSALRAARERLDTFLPLVAQGAEPSVDFRARVLAAAEATRKTTHETTRGGAWPGWQWAAAAALIVAALVIGLTLHRKAGQSVPQNELAAAQKLSEWRAPSDVLLETPGREILQTTPRLGESYLPVPAKTDRED